MEAPLSHISAARYWLAYGLQGIPRVVARVPLPLSAASRSPMLDGAGGRGKASPACSLDGFEAPSESAIEFYESLGFLGGRLHFAVNDPDERRTRRGIIVHSFRKGFPSGSVLRLSNGATICSPELTFVQMGSALPPVRLACFGMCLCGIFAVDPSTGSASDRGALEGVSHRLPRRDALAEKARIASFVESHRCLVGSGNARKALRLMVERSRSPMESATALMLAAPASMGGYALPMPSLNCRIDLPAWLHGGVGSCGRNSFGSKPYAECDFLFSHGGRTLLADYHGGWAHSGEGNVHHDSLRANAFESLGYPYFVITKQQVFDLVLLDKLVDQIRAALKIRFRTTVKDYDRKKKALHDQLVDVMGRDLYDVLGSPDGRTQRSDLSEPSDALHRA